MLGTHNSLTCFKPKHRLMNIFKCIWKCQDMSWYGQLLNIDYFDIRVRYNKHGDLVFCHGLVDLDVQGYNLTSILNLIAAHNHKCRLLLERGKDFGILFQVDKWIKMGVIDYVVIKKGWKVLYQGKQTPSSGDIYIPFYSNKSFWENLKHLKISTPYRYAKKHNPKNMALLKYDPDIIHFYDFIKL